MQYSEVADTTDSKYNFINHKMFQMHLVAFY